MNGSMIIRESFPNPDGIGEYQGIITDTDTIDFKNFSAIDYWPGCVQEFSSRYKRVALIDMLHIRREHRSMGYGRKLLERIMEKSRAYGSEAILLMADLSGQNEINLIDWYEHHGFTLYIGREHALPLMIKEVG